MSTETFALALAHNAGVYDVAGLGGLSNDDRNAKADLLRLVRPNKTKIEN